MKYFRKEASLETYYGTLLEEKYMFVIILYSTLFVSIVSIPAIIVSAAWIGKQIEHEQIKTKTAKPIRKSSHAAFPWHWEYLPKWILENQPRRQLKAAMAR